MPYIMADILGSCWCEFWQICNLWSIDDAPPCKIGGLSEDCPIILASRDQSTDFEIVKQPWCGWPQVMLKQLGAGFPKVFNRNSNETEYDPSSCFSLLHCERAINNHQQFKIEHFQTYSNQS
jgi:hypothetical protein